MPLVFLYDSHPIIEQETKKIAKKDRIELAIQQEFESTLDPATGKVPSQKLFSIFQELKRNEGLSQRNTEAIEWNERGPSNIAGRTRTILIDQSDPSGNTIFAGSVSGGIWKSTNALSANPSWQQTSGMMDNLAIGCMVQDPNNQNILYAGTGEGYFNVDAVKGIGIWKSTDGGNSWTRLSATANEDFYYTLSIGINPSGHLFACTRNNGVMRSTNGGNSWTKVLGENLGAESDRAADLEIMSDGTIFVSMGIFETDGIYRSGNNGLTWSKLSNGLPGDDYQRIEMAISPNDNNVVYALFQDESSGACSGIYKSSNQGSNWSQRNLPSAYGMSNFARNQAWYNLSIGVDPENSDHLIIGGIDLHQSENAGQSWTQISQWAGLNNTTYVHADQHVIVFDENNSDRVFFGNDGGVARSQNISSNNPQIETINNAYNVTQFYGVAIHPESSNPSLIAGAQDNGTQLFEFEGINATTEVAGGDGSICHIDSEDPNIQIATYVYNNYYLSTDGGLNFTLKSFNNGGRFANPSAYDASSQKLFSSNWSGSYFRWENPAQGGSSTQSVSVSAFNGATVTAISLSPNVPNRAYFGLDNGDVVKVDNIHTGNSKGGSIVLNAAVGSVSSIAIEKDEEEHLLVSYSNYGIQSLKESQNGGSSWSNVEGNLPDFPVRWVVFDPEDADRALIATELGVWRCDNLQGSNSNWYNEDNDLSYVRVDMLKFRESDHYLAAATHGRGLFTSTSYVNPKVNFDVEEQSHSEMANDGNFGSCNLDMQVISVPISISAQPENALSVGIQVMDNSSAEIGKDFILLTSSLSFLPGGPTNKQVQLKILDEAIQEDNEVIRLKLTGNAAFLGENDEVVLNILDDDDDPASFGGGLIEIGEANSSTYEYPFGGYYEDERSQVLYKAEELLAAGLSAGEIQQLSFYITQKSSSVPFNNFSIRLKQVEMDQLGPGGSAFIQGGTTVFTANYSTIQGWNDFPFSQPFLWDGNSDLLVDICFNNQNWSDDDHIRTSNTAYTSVQYHYSDGGVGCNFNLSSAVSNKRPDIRFEALQSIELASEICAKSSTIIQGDIAHFYYDGKLIASVENLDGSNINCMEMALDRTGDGIDYPYWMEGAGVSDKTFFIDAQLAASYEVSLYYHPDELAEWEDPFALSIIKTDGAVSENSGSGYIVLPNNELEIETLSNGIIVYKGVFDEFSGFGLTNLVPSTLPIAWKFFDVLMEEDYNLISWELDTHYEDHSIDLLRSFGGEEFESIANFDEAVDLASYFKDRDIKGGNTYYKLRFQDNEGNVNHTPLKSVFRSMDADTDLSLFPNPAKNFVYFENSIGEIESLYLIDQFGKTFDVLSQRETKEGKEVINLTGLPSGVYYLRFVFKSGEKMLERLVKL